MGWWTVRSAQGWCNKIPIGCGNDSIVAVCARIHRASSTLATTTLAAYPRGCTPPPPMIRPSGTYRDASAAAALTVVASPEAFEVAAAAAMAAFRMA